MTIRVYYEDTDVGGVVYHSNYLNFCERARSELFFQSSRSPITLNGHFVVKEIKANYLKSAKFGDLLEVKTSLKNIKNASIVMHQRIFRGDELIFEMDVKLVHLNHKGEVALVPEEDKQFLIDMIGVLE
ncbi:MAG: YbgC/FadM family acyl-CoA thioesterase [Sulfuricurvum sp.]|uniref:YbgC/FadM family acyl-CoA thioesterase n=1 Tax=Sulfuricurvum sp. TaxID=2025608 RepID=UPI00260CFB09|nr:YbgC/FadM family acyl-CoA thioesterase [Sulfuricurvum sp.]MDD2830057.1 YbgC/FadM family acyl-CoA thioesterase [Sulfuricurvum sp.]MDD4950635.1 YbgC/FadM family acyl-CoA thioesterase [Sulfuricurvum sp.]